MAYTYTPPARTAWTWPRGLLNARGLPLRVPCAFSPGLLFQHLFVCGPPRAPRATAPPNLTLPPGVPPRARKKTAWSLPFRPGASCRSEASVRSSTRARWVGRDALFPAWMWPFFTVQRLQRSGLPATQRQEMHRSTTWAHPQCCQTGPGIGFKRALRRSGNPAVGMPTHAPRRYP